ncbi:TRAP transporter solute receptor TAXI family precursor [Dehalogenimonas sp. WBC-2]|nr:TRAP transporter solute receptor TAXI family precursor [Dehalogenimonas sp. WBC-2]
MKTVFKKWIQVLMAVSLSAMLLWGCGGHPASDDQDTDDAFTWPAALHFAATGSSGEAKMVSWASVMQNGLDGPIIRVVNEAAWTNTYQDMKANQMVLSQIDKSTLKDSIEALNEYASADGGPWMAGMVWVDSLASTGFMVRGNSTIFKPEDIKPGTRIAIWNDKSATLSPFLSLLAWAGVSEQDIVWVNTGSYDACPRAVVEGRADIAMAAPVAPSVMEASAAPSGIRYISLKPADNPQGAAAFLQNSPLYDFGPITAGPDSAIGTWTISSYKYLGANMDTDPELIYNLVKWLDENYDLYKDSYTSNTNMTLQDVLLTLQTTFMPVHPGLVKYLKEKGIWNADYEKRNETNIALFQKYVDGYKEAMTLATAQNIDIKPNNLAWIEFWENYKKDKGIPLIRMHLSLSQNAAIVLPSGYIDPA